MPDVPFNVAGKQPTSPSVRQGVQSRSNVRALPAYNAGDTIMPVGACVAILATDAQGVLQIGLPTENGQSPVAFVYQTAIQPGGYGAVTQDAPILALYLSTVQNTGDVTDATNTSPIVLTVPGWYTPPAIGQTITVAGINGNTAANGTWVVQSATSTSVTLQGSVGNGVFTSSPGSTIRGYVSPGDTLGPTAGSYLLTIGNKGFQAISQDLGGKVLVQPTGAGTSITVDGFTPAGPDFDGSVFEPVEVINVNTVDLSDDFILSQPTPGTAAIALTVPPVGTVFTMNTASMYFALGGGGPSYDGIMDYTWENIFYYGDTDSAPYLDEADATLITIAITGIYEITIQSACATTGNTSSNQTVALAIQLGVLPVSGNPFFSLASDTAGTTLAAGQNMNQSLSLAFPYHLNKGDKLQVLLYGQSNASSLNVGANKFGTGIGSSVASYATWMTVKRIG